MTDIRSKIQKMKNWFKFNLFWILLGLLIVSILSIFSPFSQLNIANYAHSLGYLEVNNRTTFFSTVATSLAAILAIIFSISLVTIQHAASKYSPSILQYYKQDKPIIATYLIFIVSIAFAILSLSLDLGVRAIIISLILLIYCLFLVLFQFWRLTDMVDPVKLIKKIRDKAIKNMTRLPKELQRSIKGVKARNEFEQNLIESELYKRVRFHSDESLHEENKKYLLQLTDIIQKSTLQREYETCVAGFDAIADIVKEYVSVRQKDYTPDDKFLQHIYETLEAISKIAFRNDDVSLLQEVTKAFETIGCATTEIGVISSATGSNQITGLSGYYIHQIGMKATKGELWDVAAQAVRSLGEIGITASKKNLWSTIAVISNEIYKIGVISSLKKEWFVVQISNGELARLAIQSIIGKLHYFGAVVPIIEDIEKLSVTSIENIKGLNAEIMVGPIIGPLSDVSAKEMVKAALYLKNGDYPKIETAWREEYAKDVVSKIIDTLRAIGLSAAKNQSWIALNYANDTLREIGLICIGEKFVTFEENLNEKLIDLVNSLEEIYTECGDFSSPLPPKISESLAILGINSVENKLERITSKIISNLYYMALHTLRFDKYGYDASRIASKIDLIGVFGMEKKDDAVVGECLDKLIKFDKEYVKSYPGSEHQQHLKSLEGGYKHFKEVKGIESDYEQLFSKISGESLPKFKNLYNERISSEV